LIWLIPFYLMIALLFKTRFSLFFALVYSLIFFRLSFIYFPQLRIPSIDIPHFVLIYFIFLSMVSIVVYIVSFIFVNLSSELQKEVMTQRELLLESAKYQSLGQMASNLAHDINNPLFAIQGKLHQMRNLLSREQLDQKKCDQIVESVEATILKLSQIVKGITTFAREGRGDQMVSIRVKELVEGNLALALDRIKILRIDLEVRIDPNVQVICYPSFVSQILLNLINNAIDALEGRELKKIIVEAHIENEWVHIIVKDSGSGVPVEIENKIFDSFFTTKTFGKGTGIGLSIAKGLAEAHSGDLKYQRSSNLTNFILRLPSYE
jgi:two-component system NtrC family sensor kinase